MPLPESGWLFRRIGTDEAVTTDLMNDLFHAAERVAGLPPIPYRVWHSLRWAWATSRKDLPIKDAIAVGGWRDVRTFLGYQQTDPDTMIAVIRHDAKLHSDG
jgi:hypothetical protein